MELKTLKKYFENKCSPKEAKHVLQWIESKEALEDLEGEFKSAWQKIKVHPGDSYKWNRKLEKLHDRLEMEELYRSLNLSKKKSKPPLGLKDRPQKAIDTFPGYSRKSKIKYFVSGLSVAAFIVLLITTYFPYYELTNKKTEQVSALVQIEKQTLPGQKLSFHLEDGTKVILNAGSKLIYPSSFGSNERKVSLEGEAFFEVKKDVARPFRVVSESVITTALGTSFNVNAFSSEESIEISLVTGKVSVEEIDHPSGELNSVTLNPGEMAVILKSDYSITKSPFDFNSNVSWKDGVIYFKDASYDEVVSKLEAWYGVELQIDKASGEEWKFSGRFEKETLENILMSLQFGHDFEYKIKEKKN